MGIHSFEPIAAKGARTLILGTMPGEMSLKQGQYYAHGGNHFWKLLFLVFNQPFSKDYEVRKNLLLTNNIALWDVLQSCERIGSADSAINNEVANDFTSFFQLHNSIQRVCFNGNKAAAFFHAHSMHKPAVGYITLPSTSSANSWKTFDEKLESWKCIRNL